MTDNRTFVCALCGKDFLTESLATYHILGGHGALVIMEGENKNAISYIEYIRKISADIEFEDDN